MTVVGDVDGRGVSPFPSSTPAWVRDSGNDTAQGIVAFIEKARQSPVIAIEAESRESAWDVAEAVTTRLPDYRAIKLQAWRYSGPDALCAGIAVEVLAQCMIDAPPRRWWARALGWSEHNEAASLRMWIEDTGWRAAMQSHFDAALRVWMAAINRPVLMVIEGIDDEPVGRTLRQMLHVAATHPGTVTLLTGRKGSLLQVGWRIDLASEVPIASPAQFEEAVAGLLTPLSVVLRP